jgi:hypothetical protein
MRRFVLCSAVLAALSLVAVQQVSAGDDRANVIGTYAWTMAEGCVQQVSLPLTDSMGNILPAFGPDLTINDPLGAMTYGGAVEGVFVFDGQGHVSVEDGEATTIHNADSSYGDNAYLTPGKIPLGFGFGPPIPFTCDAPSTYTVSGRKITVDLICTASISPTNPGNLPAHNPFYPKIVTGFQTEIRLKGILPQNPSRLLLTDLGDWGAQPITLYINGGASNGGADVPASRVCARSAVAERVSGP